MSKKTPHRKRVLIVEDDREHGLMLADELEDAGYTVEVAPTAEEAMTLCEAHPPDAVLSDLQLPGLDGIALLRRLQQAPAPPAVIILTAFGTIPQAVEALKAGADNFLTKPVDFDHLLISVARACEIRDLKHKILQLEAGGKTAPGFRGIYGYSVPMRRLFEKIQLVAKAEGPVIVTGESGVGKELVAKAIHAESERREKSFVPVNCASIPENLLESELFGHAAGAFTGATKARRGLFAEADGGVLFLDEVNELPMGMQAKLLRVLQEGTIREIGSNRETSIDVRVVVATNADLEKEVTDGRFREDLFYRLEMFQLDVPPLRLRGDDVELLIAQFLVSGRQEMGKDVEGISVEAMDMLRKYSFPGNVRELQNAIKRAVAFCAGSEIQPDHLPERIRREAASSRPTAAAPGAPGLLGEGEPIASLEEMKTRYILHALKILGGNKRRTAELLGIGRRTLYRYLGGEE